MSFLFVIFVYGYLFFENQCVSIKIMSFYRVYCVLSVRKIFPKYVSFERKPVDGGGDLCYHFGRDLLLKYA